MSFDNTTEKQPVLLPEPVSDRATSSHGPAPWHEANAILGNRQALPPGLLMKPNAMTLLKALERRWLLAATLGLVAAVLASTAVWLLVPLKYTANAVIMIRAKEPKILEQDRGSEDFSVYQKTQAALLKGRFVLNAALRNPGVAELTIVKEHDLDPIEWLEGAIQVTFPSSPELMQVALSGNNPQELKIVLDAITQAYVEEVSDFEYKERSERMRKLKEVSSKYEEILRGKRRAYKDVAETAMATGPIAQAFRQGFMLEQLAAKQKHLIDVQKQLLELRLQAASKSADSKSGKGPFIPDANVQQEVNNDPDVRALQTKILQLDLAFEQVAKALQPNSPLLNDRKHELKIHKEALVTLKKEKWQSTKERLASKAKADVSASLVNDEKRLFDLREQEKILTADVKKLTEELRLAIKSGVDVEGTKDEMDDVERVARKLRDLVESLSVDANAAGRIKIQDAADVRVAKAQKRQILVAAGGGIAAMALVLLLVAYWEFSVRRIHCGKDVEFGLGWRIVGALPAVPERTGSGFFREGRNNKYWQSLLMESVDAMRTMILHAARTEGLHTVMVTSAVAGEGKTSLSCHLAASLARAGRKTLLIDCDLRSPSAHSLFDIPLDPGFCELLRGSVDFPDVIRSTPSDNLWFIPAGQIDAQVLQMLSQDRIPAILQRLKEQFDFVVIDSSPVLPVADAMVIGQNVDALIFSVLRGVSRIPNVYAAYQRLRTLGIRILGAVVNGVQNEGYGSYRYYSYNQQTTS